MLSVNVEPSVLIESVLLCEGRLPFSIEEKEPNEGQQKRKDAYGGNLNHGILSNVRHNCLIGWFCEMPEEDRQGREQQSRESTYDVLHNRRM